MKRKVLSLIMAASMMMASLVGCGSASSGGAADSAGNGGAETTADAPAAELTGIDKIIAEAEDKPILIADEPALHLTPELAIQLLQLLQQQAVQGKCVLIASRNPQLAAHANRVIDLNKFKL